MNAHVDTDAARAGATRRELVVGTALVSGALLVGCSPADLLAAGAKTEVGAFGPFIRIAADGAVTVFNKHIEFGQGSHAGLAAIVSPLRDVRAANGAVTRVVSIVGGRRHLPTRYPSKPSSRSARGGREPLRTLSFVGGCLTQTDPMP